MASFIKINVHDSSIYTIVLHTTATTNYTRSTLRKQYRGNSRNAAHSVGHDIAVALSTRLDRPLKTASGWSRLSISNSDSGFARKFNIVQ